MGNMLMPPGPDQEAGKCAPPVTAGSDPNWGPTAGIPKELEGRELGMEEGLPDAGGARVTGGMCMPKKGRGGGTLCTPEGPEGWGACD